ncbi:unnamed protein product, partial [Effrenium voratum]
MGDLLDSIENADQGIVCEAVVGSSKEGSEVATLRMEIDVSATRAHRIPRELACKEVDGWPLEKAPLRRGAPAKEILQNKVQYFVTVMVDGLPGHELCLPYVRVSMGAVSECTEAKKAHSVNNVTFDKALSINCTLVNRKAKIEILNRGSGGVFSRDKVIGEGVIYDVEPDKEYWIHCFGGAANATYPDVANQMVKGAVRPASTHTASVAVKFGTKMVSKVYFESLKRMRKPSRLTVRLYSGVNLKSYAGRKVNVVVKVPGGRLPDEAGAWHIWQNHQELERLDLETSPSHVTMLKRKALLEASDAPPQQYNTSLLAFPGEVDACGELHFVEQKARVRWVQRSTPKAWPLELPPNVQFAYLYVVAAGEEIEPPRVFGRLRLLQSDLDQVPPKWKTLHFDTSVVELPEAYYKSDLAGFLLGCASVQEQEPKVGQPPASAPSWGLCGSKPSMLPSAQTSCCAMTSQVCRASMGEDVRCQLQRPERKRTVWLHMDLLQARELPAMDDDGLVDPSYKLEVKDQTVLFPSGIMKSLSPSFMHRVCIPIEMEVEPEPTANLPLMGSFVPFPPLIVRILDRDERKVLGVAAGDDFEEVGCFVIKPASTRTLVSHGNETGKVETFPLLGYEEDEDYVLGEGGGLFAAKMPPDLDLNRSPREFASFRLAMSCKCIAAMTPGAPLAPHTIERRPVGKKDVKIDIKFAGICHSDIHQAKAEWGSNGIFPMVPGHEIGGVVSEVGPEVSKYKVGDRVGVGCMVDSCRQCDNCKAGEENYCAKGSVMTYNGRHKFEHCNEYNADGGTPTYGGYSQCVVVDENYVCKIPDGMDLAGATPLLCAGITVYSPMIHFGLKPGMKLAVAGLGGLGAMAVLIGKAMGAEVTVLSRSESKRDEAMKELKADKFIVTTDTAQVDSVKGSIDFMISTIAAKYEPAMYLGMLKTNGQMVLVGAPPEPLELHAFQLIPGRKTIAGSMIGGIKETQDMLDFCAKHGITCPHEKITADAEKVNAAYERTVKSDVKPLHVAKWYSLEKPGEAPFDAATGGVEDSWHKRPRVLAAANYSLQTNLRENLTQGKNLVKGAVRGVSIHQIQTHQSSCFKIDFRLLGLRNLPDSLVDCKLY